MLTALRDCTQVFSTLNRRFYCSNNSPYSRLLQELKECNRASNPFNFLSDREFHVYKKVLKVAPSEWNKISWENDTERKIYNKLFETQVLNSDLQDLNNYTWDNMFMQVEDLQLPLPFQKAIGDVVERTLVEYCPGMDSMLEIGSGPLPITEFLLRTPKKKKEQVILTDINDSCLKILRRQYPQTNVQKLDILSHNPLHPSYECIVMKDVFNIFTKQDLERSCKSVFNALKPGGHLIHFSIEIPIFTHLLDEFKCRDLIYLPIISENNAWEGIYVINREGFRYFLHNLNSSYQEMQELFLEYASTDPFTLDSIILERSEERRVGKYFVILSN